MSITVNGAGGRRDDAPVASSPPLKAAAWTRPPAAGLTSGVNAAARSPATGIIRLKGCRPHKLADACQTLGPAPGPLYDLTVGQDDDITTPHQASRQHR